jgi:sugar phosphate isomerase/epimerase
MAAGGGKKGMDIFIAGTDPDLVTFEIDLGWARVAGEDPLDWFRRYSGRIKMWHVKDIAALKTAQESQVSTFRELAARAANPAPAPAPVPTPVVAAGRGATPAPAPAPAITGGPVPVGAGEIDYAPILEQWKLSGLEYFFVEQDSGPTWPGGSLAAITTSYRNLATLLK